MKKKAGASVVVADQTTMGFFKNSISLIFSDLVVRYLIAGAIMLFLIYVVAVGSLYVFSSFHVKKWVGDRMEQLTVNEKLQFSVPGGEANKRYLARIQEQFSQVRARGAMHFSIIIFYYKSYFISTMMTSLLGVVAAIFLIFLSKRGWQESNPYLVICFLVTTASSLLFATMPSVFEYEHNINSNFENYSKYNALENLVRTFSKTGTIESRFMKKPIKDAKGFISFIDDQMQVLSTVPIKFNPDAGMTNGQMVSNLNQFMNAGGE